MDVALALAAELICGVLFVPLLLARAHEPVEVHAADDVQEHEGADVEAEYEPLIDHLYGHVAGAVIGEGWEGDVLNAHEDDEGKAAEEISVEEG